MWWLICTQRPSVLLTHLLSSSLALHPHSSILTPPSLLWQYSTSASAMGMSCIYHALEVFLSHRDAPCPAVLQGLLYFSAHVCLCCRDVLSPSVLQGGLMPTWAVVFPCVCPCHGAAHIQLHHGIAPCPSAPLYCHLCLEIPHQICLLPLNTRSQACALSALSLLGWGCQGPLWLGGPPCIP